VALGLVLPDGSLELQPRQRAATSAKQCSILDSWRQSPSVDVHSGKAKRNLPNTAAGTRHPQRANLDKPELIDVHPNLVANWKRQALEQLPAIFAGAQAARQHSDAEKDALYQQIGRLKVELDFLKKRVGWQE
jgi:hypothetical protein